MSSHNRKLVIITGASSGFGWASAKKFAVNGWLVVAAARRVDKLEKLQQELGEERCKIHSLDVTSEKSIALFIEFVKSLNANIDVLVNNAGLALG